MAPAPTGEHLLAGTPGFSPPDTVMRSNGIEYTGGSIVAFLLIQMHGIQSMLLSLKMALLHIYTGHRTQTEWQGA